MLSLASVVLFEMADSCCSPFNLPRHNWSSRKKSLRPVQKWMLAKANLSLESKICDSCRKKLSKCSDVDATIEPPPVCDTSVDEQYIDPAEAISSVNKCLLEIGETPMPSHPTNFKTIDKKMDRLAGAMKSLVFDDQMDTNRQRDDNSEIIAQQNNKKQ